MIYVLLIVCMFLVGLLNGLMDSIDYKNKFGSTGFWSDNSKKRKWKWKFDRQISYKKKWYYFGLYKPEFEEAFPFSSTILVFTTDGWHLCKFLMFFLIECYICAIIIYSFELKWYWIFSVFVLKGIRGLGFNLIYK